MKTIEQRVMTDIVQKDFRRWYNKDHRLHTHPFHLLHPSMQWGVYVDYWKENNIFVGNSSSDEDSWWVEFDDRGNKPLKSWQDEDMYIYYNNLTPNQTKEKAFEIRNEQLKQKDEKKRK